MQSRKKRPPESSAEVVSGPEVNMFVVFIAKWGRDTRWAPANTAIKSSPGNLQSISVSLILRKMETMQSPG